MVCRISWILTFSYVSIAWVYFRATSIGQANILLKNVITKPWNIPGEEFANAFNLGEFWYVLKIAKITSMPYAKYYLMVLFTVTIVGIAFKGRNIDELAERFKASGKSAIITAVLLIWCIVSLSGVSTFLYFNF